MELFSTILLSNLVYVFRYALYKLQFSYSPCQEAPHSFPDAHSLASPSYPGPEPFTSHH